MEKMGTGKMIEVVQSGTYSRLSLLRELLVKTFASVVTLSSSLIILYSMNPSYMFVFLGFIILSLVGGYFGSMVGRKYRRLRKESTMTHKRSVIRILMSKFEIFYNDKIDKEIEILDGYAKDWCYYDRKIAYGYIGTQLVPRVLLHSLRISLVFLFVYHLGWIDLQVHELVGIFSLFYICEKVVEDNIDIVETITKNMVNITKLREVMDDAHMNTYNYSKWEQFVLKKGDIEFQNLAFTYLGGKSVFHNFNMSIQWGKKTALVGGSWSGKTTLIKLISWYIRPDEGEIIIDNQNLKDISLKSYYKHIGYLTQEPSVFDGTIRENLEYGIVGTHDNESDLSGLDTLLHVPTTDLRKVIQLAKCERIYDLPKWLDTQIGEKWVRLSWGQRQRLAIAKIMMKNPEIILLDEPTSALDSRTEDEVTKAMNNLFLWRTVIIIAHRLQTVKHADEIICLGSGDDGLSHPNDNIGLDDSGGRTKPTSLQVSQVLERGTHEELLAKGWYYATMLELQSGF